jgi:glycerol-1-phosphate dehydrogenase [NAD(P)+]
VPVLTRLVSSPLAVAIRSGAMADLGAILADQRISTSGRLAVVISEGSGASLRERLAKGLPEADWYTVSGCSLDAAVDVADQLRTAPYDAVIGLGGGRVIDVTKYAASRVGMPMVAVATNLAHDGIASPVATLENDAGRGSYGVPTPIGVIVDLDLVRSAPQRYVRAGIGDALSNLSAIADWELSNQVTGEPIDGLAVAMARTAAEALASRTDGVRDDGFLTVLAEALLLSGIAMSVAGTSRPSSGACHEIMHAINILYPSSGGLHGEQVGVGAAFAWHLRGDDRQRAATLAVLRRHGLPTLPDELGLSVEEFVAAVRYAPSTRPGRYTILEHLDLDESAVRAAVTSFIDQQSTDPQGADPRSTDPQSADEHGADRPSVAPTRIAEK